jgi:drug/metabolite transporter (DMT)-like permease
MAMTPSLKASIRPLVIARPSVESVACAKRKWRDGAKSAGDDLGEGMTVAAAPGSMGQFDRVHHGAMEPPSKNRRDPLALAAFGALVLLVGANFVAIRYSNRELAPLWGAGVRFVMASVLFGLIAVARRLPMPRGAALAGAVLYGLLGFAAFFAFLYIGLTRASVGLGQVVVALVPLMTMLLAAVQGLEPLRWRALAGGLVALAGIAIVFGGETTTDVPPLSFLALLAAAMSFAETGLIIKRMPPADPVATNAIATAVGAAVLLGLSVVLGEPRALPASTSTWVALAYLVTLGTLAVFMLLLFLLRRWQASSVAYQFVLTPFVGAALAAALAGEPVTAVFAAGAAVVVGGV